MLIGFAHAPVPQLPLSLLAVACCVALRLLAALLLRSSAPRCAFACAPLPAAPAVREAFDGKASSLSQLVGVRLAGHEWVDVGRRIPLEHSQLELA